MGHFPVYPDSMRYLPASLRCDPGGPRRPNRSDAGTENRDSVNSDGAAFSSTLSKSPRDTIRASVADILLTCSRNTLSSTNVCFFKNFLNKTCSSFSNIERLQYICLYKAFIEVFNCFLTVKCTYIVANSTSTSRLGHICTIKLLQQTCVVSRPEILHCFDHVM